MDRSRGFAVNCSKGLARLAVLVVIALALSRPATSIHAATAEPKHDQAVPARQPSGSTAASTSASTPDVVGQWGSLMNWPLVAIHGIMLNTGKVMVWDAWEYGSTPSAQMWDPNTQTFTPAPDPFSAMFCAGQVILSDGRALVAGGHNGGGIGIVNTDIFDPVAGAWTRVADMNLARWYPTVTNLNDGRVLVMGGSNQLGAPAMAPEVYDPQANTWTALAGAQLDVGEYPQAYLMPDGRIFISAAADRQSRILDVGTQTWTNLAISPPSFGTSAMYLPGKVLEASGGSPPNDSDPVVTTTSVIDLNQPSPTWRQTAPMAFARANHNLVVLPDGKVLAVGGATSVSLISTSGVFPAEMWDPGTETWSTMASLQDPRMYHSIALLLPDGRVLSAGGGRSSTSIDYPTAQIYSPPYLFKGARPTIVSAPTATNYGGTMVVQTPDAASIGSVSFIRLGAVTHANNMDQRFIPLAFTAGPGSLTVQSPASVNIAPAGYYMLFIVNTTGVPSVANIVQITSSGTLATATATAAASATATNTASAATSTPTATSTVSSSGAVTVTAQVAASSDDANQDGSSLDLGAASVWLGNGASVTSSYAGLRFTNLALPAGASISSARLQIYSSQSQWVSVDLSLAAEAVGNSATFSAGSLPSQRALTNQKVAHSSDVLWPANTWETFDEMAPVVQELVNRADWHSGNSLSIILKGTGNAWGRKFVASFDGSPATAPKLVIVYTNGASATNTPTPTNTSAPTATRTPTPTSTALPTSTPTPVATSTATATSTPNVATSTATPTVSSSGAVTVTAQVAASSDDANQDGSSLDLGAASVWLGNGASITSSYAGLRFTNLALPAGASISSARLQIYSSQSQWVSVDLSLAAEAVGNSATFSTGSLPSQRTLTNQKVAHSSDVLWPANTWETFDEMAPVVQELVNRADWHSGNSLSIILKGTGNAWGRKFVASFDGSPATAPKLVIVYTGGATPTSTPTATPTNTSTPAATRTPTPTSTATPTASSGSPVVFPIGPGDSDVIAHQILRASNDRLYVFASQQYAATIRAFWTTSTGLPSAQAAFGGSAVITASVFPLSIDAVSDGGHFVHVLSNLNNGELRDYPFDMNAGTFGASVLLASGNPTVTGDYLGTSGLSAMLDLSGTLHVAYWAAGNHIAYRAYSVNLASGALSLTNGPIQLDTAGNANHPALAISPLDNSVTVAWVSQAASPAQILARSRPHAGAWGGVETVSSAPVWTSIWFGINVDQGPSLLIDPAGTKHLTYIENWDSTNNYGRIHYVVNSGSGWTDTALTAYSHDPALAINSAGDLYIIGHGHPQSLNTACVSHDEMCYIKKTGTTWGSPQVLATPPGNQSFDGAASVKWSVVGFNRPETIEFLFYMTPYNNPTIYYARLP